VTRSVGASHCRVAVATLNWLSRVCPHADSCNADGVAVATYNTPENLNCLSPSLTSETFLILEHAARDEACKVLIWTGAGERAFCAGAALKGKGEHFEEHVPSHVRNDYDSRRMFPQSPAVNPPDMVMARQTVAFWDFPKPLIMAVNGLAVGGGANIALANYADLVICSANARFKYPFSTLGLTPELGSSALIPFVVGMAKAKVSTMRPSSTFESIPNHSWQSCQTLTQRSHRATWPAGNHDARRLVLC
jgi:enoyl-CoA hydratase/carnithine racemase